MENVIQEKSCGAVIFKKDQSNNPLFLIEKMSLGHNSMCKGHVEEGESEHQTALREIKEETSLDVEFIDGFKEEISYMPFHGHFKRVIFFLAYPTNDIKPHDEHDDEVVSIDYYSYQEALDLLTHETDKEVLTKAYKFIIEHKI